MSGGSPKLTIDLKDSKTQFNQFTIKVNYGIRFHIFFYGFISAVCNGNLDHFDKIFIIP